MKWPKQPRLRQTKVALFGTSADPPHLGHQSILSWLAREFDQVAVWAADNPYKSEQSPIRDRAQMLRLLINTLPPSSKGAITNVSVNQSLSDRYSINSIARARKIWPKANFSFVVGADLLAQLPKWYQAKAIFDQVDILVFPRPGYPTQGPALSALQQVATVHIAHPPNQYDVSSSDVRQTHCTDNGTDNGADNSADNDTDNHTAASTHPQTIPPVIRDYITEHDLYSCLQPTSKAKISTRR